LYIVRCFAEFNTGPIYFNEKQNVTAFLDVFGEKNARDDNFADSYFGRFMFLVSIFAATSC